MRGKRTHDAREVYDGVPSLHDAKGAAIIAKLHFDGASTLLPTPADAKRRLQAVTVGVPLIDEERATLQTLAVEAHRALQARQWLWLAALRWLMKDRNAKAWFDKKSVAMGGKRPVSSP